MAKVIGSVDDRGRPVVRLEGKVESLLVVVDTGFNGDLMVTRAGAQALGLPLTGRTSGVELGDGSRREINEVRAKISWLGEEREIWVLVADNWVPKSPDDPVGLLGTELLPPHLLLVDFTARTVAIETRA